MKIKRALAFAKKNKRLAQDLPLAEAPRNAGDEAAVFLDIVGQFVLPDGALVVEYGADTGFVTRLLAQHLPADNGKSIFVYSRFPSNKTINRYLESNFEGKFNHSFDLWRHNVKKYRDAISLYKGDIRNYAFNGGTESYDLAYLGTIPSIGEIESINHLVLDKLKVGGVIVQSDYFYWDSPWAMLQMEIASGAFRLVGDLDQMTTVYVKERDLTEEEISVSPADLPDEEIEKYFSAIAERYDGARKGVIMLSRLRALNRIRGKKIAKHELDAVKDEFGGSPRVGRYIEAFEKAVAIAS